MEQLDIISYGYLGTKYAPNGRAIHYFTSTIAAYDATQTEELIHDGDVLVVESEGVAGFLHKAWPVALTLAHGEFHRPSTDYRTKDKWEEMYHASWEIAEKLIQDNL